MAAATLTSKGQITIPASIRAALGLDTGSRVEFVDIGKGQFAIVPATSPVLALKGVLGKPSKSVSIEDMSRVIAAQGSDIEADEELGMLADKAKAAADRASDSIDDVLSFVYVSNKRIAAMEAKASAKKLK